MRKIIICFVILFSGLVGSVDAQELPPPYTDDDVIITYYETDSPYGPPLDAFLIWHNVCWEAFILLNPTIDITQPIAYGTPLRLPKNQPCYQYDDRGFRIWSEPDSHNNKGVPPRLKFYEKGQWLDEPYYSTDVVYIQRRHRDIQFPSMPSAQQIADLYQVCVDDLLAENYLLQLGDAYRLNEIGSMDIFIPDDLPSCPATISQGMVEQFDASAYTVIRSGFDMLQLSQTYHVCPEAFMMDYNAGKRYGITVGSSLQAIYIPKDEPPCYNENGQRLTYFDANNHRLDTPVYSDLPVYITQPDQTLPEIAEEQGVCLVDLLRVNQFADLPLPFSIELFIPPARPCPEDVVPVEMTNTSLPTLSVLTDVCIDTLAQLNPHLNSYLVNSEKTRPVYWRSGFNQPHWILTTQGQCYHQYQSQEGESVYDIERAYNVCYEEFIMYRADRYVQFHRNMQSQIIIYIPKDVPTCYNEQGQRLIYANVVFSYFEAERGNKPTPLGYSDMRVYHSQLSDSLYDISKQFNVCVRDLLMVNPMLRRRVPQGHPVFIPNVRPCYDPDTGKQWIYEDNAGNPLPEPILSEYLVHYGEPVPFYLQYFYNVCLNRILDATAQADFDRLEYYHGYIIPTDRPPCFDKNWQKADYICYDQPIGHERVYQPSTTMTFSVDGEYCYDFKEPNTVIWYQNKPYQAFSRADRSFAVTQGLVAWCFGASLEDLRAIHQSAAFRQIRPINYYIAITPLPTRDCYLTNPSILDGKLVHTVDEGETLHQIAQKYHIPHILIAWTNELPAPYAVWTGQKLIIPQGIHTEDLLWLAGLATFWLVLITLFYGWRKLKKAS